MIPKKRKERAGKTHCDLCGEARPPIHEYEFPFRSNASHWFDLCEVCGAVDREMRDGFLVGVHSPTVVEYPPRKPKADGASAYAQLTQPLGRPKSRPTPNFS